MRFLFCDLRHFLARFRGIKPPKIALFPLSFHKVQFVVLIHPHQLWLVVGGIPYEGYCR